MSNILAKKRTKKGIEQSKKSEVFRTPYNDLSQYRYTRTWEQGLTTEVYGYTVNLPDMPDKKDIVNYGRPISEQIFRKTKIPEGLHHMDEDEKEAFIEREHHRRLHGMWFYIKGEPIYIPGLFYYFMNYWVTQAGDETFFRIGDWKFFIIWMHVVLSDHIHGLVDFKCRRIGDTEKALCMVYEYASRVKNTINQMFDCRVETDIKETFARLKFAHQNMVWFMKPVAKDDDPGKTLDFRFPNKKIDVSNSYIDEKGVLKNFDYEYPQNGSKISYGTNPGEPDGKRIGRLYVDEFGKMNQVNPRELWKVGRKALDDDARGMIIGKGLFTSTIEDLEGGKALEMAKYFWKNSDPSIVNDKGQTTTGLIRIIRSVLDREELDRWGFHKEDLILDKIKKQREFLTKNKNWSELIDYRRQNCLTIQDIFSNISKGSPFDIEKINSRHNELTFDLTDGYVRGNLEWVDGIKPIAGDPMGTNKNCRVYFEPNDEGRWYISKHPKDYGLEENKQKSFARVPMPGNTRQFSCGIDPVSYKENLENDEKSLSGLSIKRNLDLRIDNPNNTDLFDVNGDPIDGGRFFKTNRYCCVYLYRHKNPNDNYDDWLKSVVYYGCDFLIEKNHSGGFYSYLDTLGFIEYYMDKSGIANYKGQQEKLGYTATEKAVETYFSAIGSLVSQYWNTIDIPLITEQLQTMEYDTRTKHDLGVSIGFCEVAANSKLVEEQKYLGYESDSEEGIEMTEVNYDFD